MIEPEHRRTGVERRQGLPPGTGELGVAQPIAALIGADAFRQLATWREWRTLFELAHLVALTRPAHLFNGGGPLGWHVAGVDLGRAGLGLLLLAIAAGRARRRVEVRA